MNTQDAIRAVLGEVTEVLHEVDTAPVEELVEVLLAANRIYVTGEGRSGLIARTFAMRLIHLGMTAFVCGETVTPAIASADLCLACSGSGETPITCHRASRSAKVGSKVAAVVSRPGTSLGTEADIEIVLPCPTVPACASTSQQFGATLFEQALLVLLDAVVMLLRERRGTSHESMSAKHANLE
jgi:6-phospho-3-hexuloisomerase